MSDDSSSSSTAAPPADRVHDEPATAASAAGHASDPHGPGGHKPHVAHHFHSLSQQFAVEKLGIWLFLATEVLMFGGLFCAYAFYRGLHPEIFLYGHQFLPTNWGAINTVVLLTSSLTMAWGVRAAQLNQRGVLKIMLIATFLGGVGFMVIKGIEYSAKFEHDLGPGPGNAFYPLPEGLSEEERADLVDARFKEIAHIEEYYGIRQHAAPVHSDGEHAASADPRGEAPGDAVEGQADPADPAEGAEDAAGGGGEAETQTESKTRLVTADLPRKEQSVVSPPAAPSNGVNAAFLTGTTPAGEHNTYSYAQLPEIDQKRTHVFFQIYYLMTGLHGIHVLVGMGLIGWLIVRAFGGAFSSVSFTAVDVVGLYWHLVDLIWIFLFPLLYLIH